MTINDRSDVTAGAGWCGGRPGHCPWPPCGSRCHHLRVVVDECRRDASGRRHLPEHVPLQPAAAAPGPDSRHSDSGWPPHDLPRPIHGR